MALYRLMSTHHNVDGSVDQPSVVVPIRAGDDREALAIAREVPPPLFAEDADYAWIVDETDHVVGSFVVAFGRAA